MVNARVAQSGAVPLAKSSAAADNNCNTSGSSRHTRNTSLVQPPGPEALPSGALRKHSAKIFLSNSKGALGWKFNTSSGISLSTSWGRHRCWVRARLPPKLGGRATPALAGNGFGLGFPCELGPPLRGHLSCLSLSGKRAN